LPCTTSPLHVNEVAFYQCGTTWFTRAYIGGSVSYVVTGPPPGH
jgi:cysteinyl-tRNA synthetase